VEFLGSLGTSSSGLQTYSRDIIMIDLKIAFDPFKQWLCFWVNFNLHDA